MPPKLLSPLFPWLILLTLFLYSTLLSLHAPSSTSSPPSKISISPTCNFFTGKWVRDPNRKPMYDESCPFHRNAWNCLKNKRENMDSINSRRWKPKNCDLPRIDPFQFLGLMRGKNIGLVGDSLNENFLVSFLCVLRVADLGAKKWKKKGAWRGAYFPKFNVTVAYHRAVLLANYKWQSALHDEQGLKGTYRVDVDIPSDDWVNITESSFSILVIGGAIINFRKRHLLSFTVLVSLYFLP